MKLSPAKPNEGTVVRYLIDLSHAEIGKRHLRSSKAAKTSGKRSVESQRRMVCTTSEQHACLHCARSGTVKPAQNGSGSEGQP